MKTVHKIIFSIAISLAILMKILTMPVHANAAVAPFLSAAGEAALAALFGAVLVSCGFVDSATLQTMTNDEIMEESKKLFAVGDIAYRANLDELKEKYFSGLFSDTSLGYMLADFISSYDVLGNPTFDMKGAGAVLIFRDRYGYYNYYYGTQGYFKDQRDDGYSYEITGVYYYEMYNSSFRLISSEERYSGIQSAYYYGDDTKFYGSWIWQDTGEPGETNDEYDFSIGQTEDGTKVSADQLNPDGTVTVEGEDGTTVDIPVNVDWDIFDEDALWDFIRDLLDFWDDSASRTDSSELADSVIDSVGDVALELEGLDGLLVPSSIVHVFPFCLPFDFVQGMYLFQASPEVPHFESELDFTNLMGYNLGKYTLVIDLGKFETLAKISRWLTMILFIYSLILLTGKIVKGAGA